MEMFCIINAPKHYKANIVVSTLLDLHLNLCTIMYHYKRFRHEKRGLGGCDKIYHTGTIFSNFV